MTIIAWWFGGKRVIPPVVMSECRDFTKTKCSRNPDAHNKLKKLQFTLFSILVAEMEMAGITGSF